MEDGNNLTESVNQALKVLRYKIHTGLKKKFFELHHGRKPRTQLLKIIKDGVFFISDLSAMSILAPNKPKIPKYVGRVAGGKSPTI